MVKVDNVFGDVKTGAEGPGVYQNFYGRQVRRKREERKRNDSPPQKDVQEGFKEGINFASSLTQDEIKAIKAYIRTMGWSMTWHNFARRVVMSPVKVDHSELSVISTQFPLQLKEWDYRNGVQVTGSGSITMLIELQGSDPSEDNYVDFSRFKENLEDLRITDEDGPFLPIFIQSYDRSARKARVLVSFV